MKYIPDFGGCGTCSSATSSGSDVASENVKNMAINVYTKACKFLFAVLFSKC